MNRRSLFGRLIGAVVGVFFTGTRYLSSEETVSGKVIIQKFTCSEWIDLDGVPSYIRQGTITTLESHTLILGCQDVPEGFRLTSNKGKWVRNIDKDSSADPNIWRYEVLSIAKQA